jgi:hypothetical protein
VSQQHLKRYLGEFDFRYNERASLGVDDDQRMAKAAKGIQGKRLTYRRTRGQSEPEETGSAQTRETNRNLADGTRFARSYPFPLWTADRGDNGLRFGFGFSTGGCRDTRLTASTKRSQASGCNSISSGLSAGF